jgi:hypothetical protein
MSKWISEQTRMIAYIQSLAVLISLTSHSSVSMGSMMRSEGPQ